VLLKLEKELLLSLEELELERAHARMANDGYVTGVPLHVTLPDKPLLFLGLNIIEPTKPCPTATRSETS
jgi:hypothetical protein